MDIDTLVAKLDKVAPAGNNRWKGCCPAHEDKTPSLSIKSADDGRILLHCFGGCSVQDVCESLGVEVTDLFPDGDGFRPLAKPANIPTDDTFYVALVKQKIKRGDRLTSDENRQFQAAFIREKRRVKGF